MSKMSERGGSGFESCVICRIVVMNDNYEEKGNSIFMLNSQEYFLWKKNVKSFFQEIKV